MPDNLAPAPHLHREIYGLTFPPKLFITFKIKFYMENNRSNFVYMVSLGCPKNLVDTELAAGSMLVNNIGFAESPDDADVYFINTCAFIAPAREEAEEFIAEAVEWKNNADGHSRKIIVAGCLVQWDKNLEFRNGFPEVDLWLPIDEVHKLPEHISSLSAGNISLSPPATEPKYIYTFSVPRLQLTPPHLAYLKIAEGCSNNCSYCSIPAIRGKRRCRTIADITTEAKNLITNGVKELILTAQDTTLYTDPGTSEKLETLIRKIDALKGDFRIRLLYAHPAHISKNVIELFRNANHLLPYIDLPLQHISDTVLKSMNRRITSCEVRRIIDELRESNPDIALRTTFLLGFPGETEQDFEGLCRFIKEIQFERLGVFPYSQEPDTPAAAMPDQVPAETTRKRCGTLMAIQSEISMRKNKSLIGKKMDVMIDYAENGYAEARTYMDAYEIDNTVELSLPENFIPEPGTILSAKITKAANFAIEGTFIQN